VPTRIQDSNINAVDAGEDGGLRRAEVQIAKGVELTGVEPDVAR
jgi:hypothetical protein